MILWAIIILVAISGFADVLVGLIMVLYGFIGMIANFFRKY